MNINSNDIIKTKASSLNKWTSFILYGLSVIRTLLNLRNPSIIVLLLCRQRRGGGYTNNNNNNNNNRCFNWNRLLNGLIAIKYCYWHQRWRPKASVIGSRWQHLSACATAVSAVKVSHGSDTALTVSARACSINQRVPVCA